jgi:hypothetical protein
MTYLLIRGMRYDAPSVDNSLFSQLQAVTTQYSCSRVISSSLLDYYNSTREDYSETRQRFNMEAKPDQTPKLHVLIAGAGKESTPLLL